MIGSKQRGRRLALIGGLIAASAGLGAPPAAADELVWVRQFGTAEDDRALGVATDGTGNVFLAGDTQGPLVRRNPGFQAAWVAKYDGAGELSWRRQLGAGGGTAALSVATDGAGNVLLAGNTWDSLGGRNSGYDDGWVAKLDTTGDVSWKRQFGTSEEDVAAGVAADGTGNVFVAGYSLGSLGGRNRGSFDAWVAKLNGHGTLAWKLQLGGDRADLAYGVATDPLGNVFVAGGTAGSLGGHNRGRTDAWVAKLDAGGDVLWKRQFGEGNYEAAHGLATDSDGSVYVAGQTSGNQNFGWIVKYDAAGNVSWKREFGAGILGGATGVAIDSVGNVLLAGNTYGPLGGSSGNGWESWVVKLGASGVVLSTSQIGTTGTEQIFGVAADGAGDLFLAGETRGSFSGHAHGERDAWVAKSSPTE